MLNCHIRNIRDNLSHNGMSGHVVFIENGYLMYGTEGQLGPLKHSRRLSGDDG